MEGFDVSGLVSPSLLKSPYKHQLQLIDQQPLKFDPYKADSIETALDPNNHHKVHEYNDEPTF